VAVVYPVPANLVDRLLIEDRNVFVKYLPRTTKVSLQQGDKVVFYASHATKQVVGEGVAEKVEFLTPAEAISKYGEKVFLSKDELAAYTARQPSRDPSKKMLVVVLTKLKKYKKGIVYPRPITMAGEYLTEEQYRQLIG
jgi:hypothetical protein